MLVDPARAGARLAAARPHLERPPLNNLEERHLTALAELRGASSLTLLDLRKGELGPEFAEIEPLVMFDEEWAGLRLDDDMPAGSLRFEVAAHWESGAGLPPFSEEYRVPAPMEVLSQGRMPSLETHQTEFLSHDDPALAHVAEGLRNGLDALPGLFPGPDYAPLAARLASRTR